MKNTKSSKLQSSAFSFQHVYYFFNKHHLKDNSAKAVTFHIISNLCPGREVSIRQVKAFKQNNG